MEESESDEILMQHQNREELQYASNLDAHPSNKSGKLTRLLPGFAVFFLALVYFLPKITVGVESLYDEGIHVYGAERVLIGDRPYHDFYCIYGPGAFYWLAALFKVFGVQLIVSRLNDAVICALTGSLIFIICRKLGLAKPWSLISTLVYLAALEGSHLKMVSPALMLILAAGLRLTEDLSRNRRPWLTGMLLGLAAVFRHDFGVFGFVASLAVILCPRGNSQGKQEKFRSSVSLLTGFVLIAGAVYGALLSAGFYAVFENLVIFPSKSLPYRVLPYPIDLVNTQIQALASLLIGKNVLMNYGIALFMISQLLVFIGPILIVFLLMPLVKRNLRRELFQYSERQTLFLFLLSLAVFFLPYSFGRCDFLHMFPFFVISLPISLMLIHFYLSRFKKVCSILRPITLLFLSFFILDLAGVFFINVMNFQKGVPINLNRTQGIISIKGKESEGLVELIHELETDKRPSPIFVGSPQHDKVFINAVMVYFLSGRRSGTLYHHFDPGVTNTRIIQQKIINDLETNQVDTVVLWNQEFINEPNQSRESSDVTLLDEYIDQNFIHTKKIGEFTLKRR